jgi:hypothetical protein
LRWENVPAWLELIAQNTGYNLGPLLAISDFLRARLALRPKLI